MGNKSAEYPAGVLNKDVLKSFIGITGPEDNLTWTYGAERIPENWYKRNDADQYGLVGSTYVPNPLKLLLTCPPSSRRGSALLLRAAP